MYQYRIFQRAWGGLRVTLTALAIVAFLLLGGETLRVYLHLYELSPLLGIFFNLAFAAMLFYLLRRIRRHRREHAILNARGLTTSEHARQSELERTLRHLILCGRRIARQRLLPSGSGTRTLQKAHDLQAALDHHPLRDDLLRGLVQARTDMLGPAWEELDAINDRLTRAKAIAILQDTYQPPFPVLPTLVAVYHQATMVSQAVDLYLPQPSLGEYARALSDTWDVMTKGDFLRLGQRIYAGIEASHNLGPASLDLGQAISLVWITHCVARVATHRCQTLHDWSLHAAIRDVQPLVIPLLQKTRDLIAGEGMPVILSIINRHNSASPGRDPRAYASELAATLIKALDHVIATTRAELEAAARVRASAPVAPVDRTAASASSHPPETIHHRRRRKRRPRNLFQRITRWFKPTYPLP